MSDKPKRPVTKVFPPEVYSEFAEFCKKSGIQQQNFAGEAIRKELLARASADGEAPINQSALGLNVEPVLLEIPEEEGLAFGVENDWRRFKEYVTNESSQKIAFEDILTEDAVDDVVDDAPELQPETPAPLNPARAFNKMTFGGVAPGTLNFLLGDAGAGKSLVLDHLAASYLRTGRSVLVLTLELSHHETFARVAENYFDLDINTFFDPKHPSYNGEALEKLGKAIIACNANLEVKSYLYSEKHVGHFSKYISVLAFVPDVIIVDAAEHCLTQNLKANMHVIPKELKSLALKHKAILWTAVQADVQRGNRTPLDVKYISGSQAVNRYADLIIAVNKVRHPTFTDKYYALRMLRSKHGAKDDGYEIVRVDKNKMRLYQPEEQQAVVVKAHVEDWYNYQAPVQAPVAAEEPVAAEQPVKDTNEEDETDEENGDDGT